MLFRFRSRVPIVLLLGSAGALAQFRVGQFQHPDPVNSAIQDYWQASSQGRFDEAAAKRTALRALLDQVPVDAPQFANWVQQVAQLYQSAGRTGEARTVYESAVARTSGLRGGDLVRSMLQDWLANSWQQDGNLLKELEYREKALAVAEGSSQPANVPFNGIWSTKP